MDKKPPTRPTTTRTQGTSKVPPPPETTATKRSALSTTGGRTTTTVAASSTSGGVSHIKRTVKKASELEKLSQPFYSYNPSDNLGSRRSQTAKSSVAQTTTNLAKSPIKSVSEPDLASAKLFQEENQGLSESVVDSSVFEESVDKALEQEDPVIVLSSSESDSEADKLRSEYITSKPPFVKSPVRTVEEIVNEDINPRETEFLSSTLAHPNVQRLPDYYLPARYSEIVAQNPLQLQFSRSTSDLSSGDAIMPPGTTAFGLSYTPPGGQEVKVQVMPQDGKTDEMRTFYNMRKANITKMEQQTVELDNANASDLTSEADRYVLMSAIQQQQQLKRIILALNEKILGVTQQKDRETAFEHLQEHPSIKKGFTSLMLAESNLKDKSKDDVNVTAASINNTTDFSSLNLSGQAQSIVANPQLATQVRINRKKLPYISITRFMGDSKFYPKFRSDYQNFVGNDPQVSTYEKMHHLSNSLGPDVKKLIDTLQWDDEGYREAWRILDAKYLLPFEIAIKWEQELRNLPRVRPNNAEDLEKHFLKASAAVNGLKAQGKSLTENGWHWLLLTAAKLDPDLRVKWEEALAAKKLIDPNLCPMSVYLDFVDQRQRLLSKITSENKCSGTSVASHNNTSNHNGNRQARGNGKARYDGTTNATSVGLGTPGAKAKPFSKTKKRPKPNKSKTAAPGPVLKTCCWCGPGSTHNPSQCKKDKQPASMYNAIYRDKICTSCLQSNTHLAPNCPKRKPCSVATGTGVCGKQHHPALHNAVFKTFQQWKNEGGA